MAKEFPFVEVPAHLLKLVGKPDPGTRLYRRYGTEADLAPWFEAVWEICKGKGSVSPGTVSAYAKVSRPAVHKRLREGRLTGFFFHQTKPGRFFKDRKTLDKGGRPYIFIPVTESKAWAEELKERQDLAREDRKIPETTRKYDGIIKAPRNWRKDSGKVKEE